MKTPQILTSSEPIENALLKWRKLYWLALPCAFLGLFIESFMGIAILYLMVVYLLTYFITRSEQLNSREMKFKFISGVSKDDILPKLSKALIANYGSSFMVEKDGNGEITISYDGLIYDLIFEEDYFRIYWRMSVVKAFFHVTEYKLYRKILIAMGMIGYELQKLYDINTTKEGEMLHEQ